MAKKIDASRWKNPFIENKEFYLAETIHITGGDSVENGKSTQIVQCGFCKSEHEVYIWSFAGGGKRCGNCGSIMFNNQTLAEKDRVDISQIPEKIIDQL